MKKKYLILSIFCFIAVMAINLKQEHKSFLMNNIMFANIEALACGESMTEEEFAKLGCECAEPEDRCTGKDGKTYSAAIEKKD